MTELHWRAEASPTTIDAPASAGSFDAQCHLGRRHFNRRDCGRWLGALCASSLASCGTSAGRTQSQSQSEVRSQRFRVGLLFPDAPEAHAVQLERLQNRLRALGLEPGKDVLLDARYARGSGNFDPEAQALAATGAAAYIGATLGPTAALGRATAASSAPVLFVAIGDPVARGLVAEMRSPGGRFTGSSDLVPDVARHRMDLLAEAVPTARKVALISNGAITPRALLDTAASRHGMHLLHVDVREAKDFGAAYAAMEREQPEALVVTPNGVTYPERHRLCDWARVRRLPTLFGWRDFMDAGGLLSLGANTGRLYDVAAEQLVQVLRGVPPARIPVASAQLELVVDLRTASQLGVTVPRSVVSRADLVL